jgi:uncharacterized linocin/CFP29 family protein
MNNLYRELAPVSDAAWASIEQEARRTFELYVAGRRVVDTAEPAGVTLAAVSTGHLRDIDPPGHGVSAALHSSLPVVELRVPFTLSRREVDSVERGAQDPDWQPVKDAAKGLAFAEDRAIFDGYPAAEIKGIREASSNPGLAFPASVRDYPDVISRAVSALRLAGVAGPYHLVLSLEEFTAVSETTDHGYPVRDLLTRVVDGDIVFAPAITGGVVLTGRGGDYELRLGQDVSIGYLGHDAATVQLYFTESFTFAAYTAEASVSIAPA